MPHTPRTGFGSLQETETDAVTSSVSVFENEIIEKAVTSRKNCIVRPTAISDAGPIHVQIVPEGDYWIDPSTLRLNIDLQVKKSLNAKPTEWIDLTTADMTTVAPVNLSSKCLIRDIETWMQAKQVSLVATAAYPVKAYIETVASYGQDAANGHLKCSYYLKDLPGKADDVGNNTSFTTRHKYIKKSRMYKVCDTMHTELTTMDKYILPGITIDFRFSLNNAGYFLQIAQGGTANDNYKYEIKDFWLSFDRVTIAKDVYTDIEKKLSAGNKAVYVINRGTIRSKQFPQDQVYAKWQSLYTGTLPDSVTIAMIDSRAFNGNIDYNIFNFQHFKAESLSLKVNSVSLPSQPLTMDFPNGDIIRAYRHFFDNIGINNGNSPCLITFDDFRRGTTLFPFDLTPDKCSSYHGHVKQTGNIELDVRFGEALPSTITILALCNFSDRIYILGPQTNREILINPDVSG